jgi:hypothetical protein
MKDGDITSTKQQKPPTKVAFQKPERAIDRIIKEGRTYPDPGDPKFNKYYDSLPCAKRQAKATPSKEVRNTPSPPQPPVQSQQKEDTCSTAAKLCQLFSPKPTKKDKNNSPGSDDTLIVPVPEETTLKTGIPDGAKEGFTIIAPKSKKKKKNKKGNRGGQTVRLLAKSQCCDFLLYQLLH